MNSPTGSVFENAPNRYDSSFSKDTSASNSYSVPASFRDDCRAAGSANTLTFVSRLRRRMAISSPGLTTCEALAVRWLRVTSFASQIDWATLRLGQRRLALRNRSRRTESRMSGNRIQKTEFRKQNSENRIPAVSVSPSPRVPDSRPTVSSRPLSQLLSPLRECSISAMASRNHDSSLRL